MFSYQDLTIIASFSRLCQKNKVPRDMEVEVLRYFNGLNESNFVLLQVWTYHTELDDCGEIDPRYYKLFNKNLYNSNIELCSAIMKHVIALMQNMAAKYPHLNDVIMTVDGDSIVVTHYDDGVLNYSISSLTNILATRNTLTNDDFPMLDITSDMWEINLVDFNI